MRGGRARRFVRAASGCATWPRRTARARDAHVDGGLWSFLGLGLCISPHGSRWQCSGLRSRAALRACGVGLRAWPHGRACARDSDGGTADRPGSSSVAASSASTGHQPPLGSWQCGGLLHARRGPRCCGEARHQHGALPGLPRGWPSQARVPRLPMSSLEQWLLVPCVAAHAARSKRARVLVARNGRAQPRRQRRRRRRRR